MTITNEEENRQNSINTVSEDLEDADGEEVVIDQLRSDESKLAQEIFDTAI